MAILKSFSISNTQILASTLPKNSSSHSISKSSSSSLPRIKTPSSQSTTPPQPQNKHNNPTKPSIAEIERAIGAGAFRDPTLYRRTETNAFAGEWPVEKKLREVGEWLLETAEISPKNNSSGKQILKAVFLWILPAWILAFLVAARIIELPFDSAYLDDLLL